MKADTVNLQLAAQVMAMVIIVIYLFGHYEHHVHLALAAPIHVLKQATRALRAGLQHVRRQLPTVITDLFSRGLALSDNQKKQNIWPGWPWVGAVIYLVVFIYFIYTDFYILLLTFDAIGLGTGNLPALPLPPDQLLALSAVTISAFWGAVYLDIIGLTHLGPVAHLEGRRRAAFQSLSVAMLAITIMLFGALGLLRGGLLQQPAPVASSPALEPDDSIVYGQGQTPPILSPDPSPPLIQPETPPVLVDERTIQTISLAANTALPMLMTVSAALAGWGVGGVLALLLGLVLVALWLILTVAQLLTNVIQAALDALWWLVGRLTAILGDWSRRAWNFFAEADPFGGKRLFSPIAHPAELPKAIEVIYEQARERLQTLSMNYQNQAYDQAHPPKEADSVHA